MIDITQQFHKLIDVITLWIFILSQIGLISFASFVVYLISLRVHRKRVIKYLPEESQKIIRKLEKEVDTLEVQLNSVVTDYNRVIGDYKEASAIIIQVRRSVAVIEPKDI